MKPSNFAKYLTDFLTIYLCGQKNVSKNTVYAYRDTFKLLLKYCLEEKALAIERISMEVLTAELIIDFLNWLEIERKSSVSTRNQRLAAIHSFFRYVQGEDPVGIYNFQKVISVPIKKTIKTVVEHFSPDVMQLILEQPDKKSSKGRRDLTLLSILYDTGARVQELIDIKVCDLILDSPAVVVLTGKGNKIRRVPLMKNAVALLQAYLSENDLNKQCKNQYPLFSNNQHNKLTKEGVSYILNKYVKMAREKSPRVPEHAFPHMIRHSKAMHLLQADVNLIYIRDFLGHVDLKTTEVYARTNTETKRKAIENVYPDIISSEMPDWSKDKNLLSWLSDLK